MLDRVWIYDILYALAASDGRQERLFGDCMHAAHAAFERSIVGTDFPELWFEIPLAGDPWFDLHVLTEWHSLAGGVTPAPDAPSAQLLCPEVFEWFAAQGDDVRQLALSHDPSTGELEQPAVQLLLRRRSDETACSFFEAAGNPDAPAAYRAFLERMPAGWFACYAGVFPGRPGFGVRIECIPDRELQQAYADDADLLERHLLQTGIVELGDTLVERTLELAGTPFQLEFQFDVGPDGATRQVLGVSLRFASPGDESKYQAFHADGAAGELMGRIEAWGLVDERWRLFEQATYAKKIALGDDAMRFFNYPAFVKLRWRDGEPLDAKVYFICGAML